MSEQNQMNKNENQINEQSPQNGNQQTSMQNPYPQMVGQGNPQWNYQVNSNTMSYPPQSEYHEQQQQGMNYQPERIPTEASYQNYGTTQRYAQSLPNGYQPPQTKSKVGLFVALSLVVVILSGLGGAYALGIFAGKTNVEKLFDAILQSNEIKQVEEYSEIGIDEFKMAEGQVLTPVPIIDLIDGAGLNIHVKSDKEKNKHDLELKLNLKDLEVLDLFFQQQDNEQIVAIPKLFKGLIYFSEGDLKEQLSDNKNAENMIDSFHPDNVEKSMKYLKPALNPMTLKSFKTLEKKKYISRIKDRYNELLMVKKGSRTISVNGEDRVLKGDVYEITENMGEMAEFYFGLISEMLADENFKPFVTEYLERLINTAEANKDVLLYNYITMITGNSDFKKEWDDDVMSELIYQKEFILESLDSIAEEWKRPSVADATAKVFSAMKGSGSEINMVFVVDKIIVYSSAQVTINALKITEMLDEDMAENLFETLKYHVNSAVLATNGDVKFKEFDKSKTLDYTNASQEELERLMEEIQGNLMNIVFFLGIF